MYLSRSENFHSDILPDVETKPSMLRCAPLATTVSKRNPLSLYAQSISDLVKKVESASAKTKAPTKIFKSLKKTSGSPSISVEFLRPEKIPVHDTKSLSFEIRRSKVALLVVDTAVANGDQDFEGFVKEQQTAKGKFPGPVPLVWRGAIETIEDIAKAKAAGADGVSFAASSLGEEKTAVMVNACHVLGMEPLVEVGDANEINWAVSAGAKCLCVRFSSSAISSFLVSAAKSLQNDLPDDCAVIATVQGRQGGAEIEQAKSLLDANYNGVLFSRMLEDATDRFSEPYLKYIMAVMQSKKSQNLQINEIKVGYEP
ncbi:hypothetical protein GUITHDRAFT_111316 [Guillardia theta CCMP2712]|uniref:indole-3-glycerol-phosphate synthase n=1 Tax=Guillardia theta (strain CCMP2712) TaxID=905079 RepID=L1J287_GUITC|nr:hypothetical protein GUITHDRAFT_111316 [Guillardia theta CCMP2712]EKX42636.1 hypothetical protein GUITHDRAFT_111316 [Guillardia theta CCMP2712]|eukprot:XP_005829616.1 hypothetical protein GUITHDRAFT_111316 [Guillardia theta CCMP2712]